jgi:glycosyltransferase involved in cell wall biosynthesis
MQAQHPSHVPFNPRLRVLHAYNLHRGGGGADNATHATIAVLREAGVEVDEFVRDSGSLGDGLGAKLRAFAGGLYARDAVREFSARLDARRPDLVHVHELYPLISPWVLPECSRRGIPVVMSVYDYRLTCPTHNHFFDGRVCQRCAVEREWACVRQNCRGSHAESLAFALRNTVARRAQLFTGHVSCFITPTRFTADWLVQQAGVAADAVRVLPCMIDMPEAPVDDPAAGRYIAFAGRFVPEKGADIAIAAARQAGLPLWLAGDRHQSLDGRHSDNLVRFLVTHDRAELAAFYRGARALVMPSVWFESFGIVVGEAMSHGIPVLASRIGALAETTVDGQTGLLFEPGDVDDLARAMRRLWDDADLLRRLGSGGRAHIERQSSPAMHRLTLLGIYAGVLARCCESSTAQ